MRFSGMPWRPISGSRYQDAPLFTGWFFGKPLHTISRFRHQDAQPPPSPRVGEGGRGDEGQKAPNLPLRPVWEKGVGGMRGKSARECNQTINPRCLATACALSFEPGAEFDPPAAMLPLPTLAYTPVRGCCLAAHWDSE
jgi:hypothetical protein